MTSEGPGPGIAALSDIANTSLRRVLTRAAHGQHARLLSLSSMALEAAAEWVAADPHSRGRELDADVLGVGVLGVEDVSQMQLWRDAGPQNVTVTVTAGGGQVPAGERAALRLAAGTSPKAVAKRINDLVTEHGVVTAAEVFERTLTGAGRISTASSGHPGMTSRPSCRPTRRCGTGRYPAA